MNRVKVSKCPHCFTSEPPEWTERSPNGLSKCSQCSTESPNPAWVIYEPGPVSYKDYAELAKEKQTNTAKRDRLAKENLYWDDLTDRPNYIWTAGWDARDEEVKRMREALKKIWTYACSNCDPEVSIEICGIANQALALQASKGNE